MIKLIHWLKLAINIPPDKTSKLPYTDLKHKIKQIITTRWQQLRDENAQNKLRQIDPLLKERKREASNTRREETTSFSTTYWPH